METFYPLAMPLSKGRFLARGCRPTMPVGRNEVRTMGSTPVRAGIVSVDDPEHMNLLGLLMAGLLESRLSDPALRDRALRMRGAVAVRAGDMEVALRFGETGPVVQALGQGRFRARVSGSMPAMLGVVSGGPMVSPVLQGRLRVSGNPFWLLSLLPLLRP